jgi:hypothetical protein
MAPRPSSSIAPWQRLMCSSRTVLLPAALQVKGWKNGGVLSAGASLSHSSSASSSPGRLLPDHETKSAEQLGTRTERPNLRFLSE